MTPLSRAEVDEIALLARLHLEDDEAERLRGELSAILGAMEKLQAVDTTGVEPMTHALPMELRLRDDVAAPSLPVEAALADAPDRADDFFAVPRILPAGQTE